MTFISVSAIQFQGENCQGEKKINTEKVENHR